MNKKELIEELKNNMPILQGNEEEKELETALYVYIELAKRKNFDVRYWWGNEKQIKKVAAETKADSMNLDRAANKKVLTCVSLASLYSEILSNFGIKSIISVDEGEEARRNKNVIPHRNVVIQTKTGKSYNTDLQRDLYRVHSHMSLQHFAQNDDGGDKEVISQETLNKFLMDIGYIQNENDYSDNIIEDISKIVDSNNLKMSLKSVLEDERISTIQKDAGIVEASSYYSSILNLLFSKEKLGNTPYEILKFPCKRKNEQTGEYDYTFCIYGIDHHTQEADIYLYSPKKSRMISCDIETISKLEKQGLVLGRNPKDKRTGLLRQQMKKYKKMIKKEEEK